MTRRELAVAHFFGDEYTLISTNSPANRADLLDVRPKTAGICADLLIIAATRMLVAEKIASSHSLREFPPSQLKPTHT